MHGRYDLREAHCWFHVTERSQNIKCPAKDFYGISAFLSCPGTRDSGPVLAHLRIFDFLRFWFPRHFRFSPCYANYLIPRCGTMFLLHTYIVPPGRPRSPLASASCQLMGWSGRAPAPPAVEADQGRQRRGARHVSEG